MEHEKKKIFIKLEIVFAKKKMDKIKSKKKIKKKTYRYIRGKKRNILFNSGNNENLIDKICQHFVIYRY